MESALNFQKTYLYIFKGFFPSFEEFHNYYTRSIPM